MKAIRLGVFFAVAFAAVALFIGLVPHHARAGGIDHTITVHNPLDSKVRVSAGKVKANIVDVEWTSWVVIPTGGSQEFHSGALCPCGVRGQYWDAVNRKWVKMKGRNCLGSDMENVENNASTCCWSYTVKTCQKAGHGYNEVREYDFGFCKN